MCIAQLLSPADMVDVGAGLTLEEGGLFSIAISAFMNEVAEEEKEQKQEGQHLSLRQASRCPPLGEQIRAMVRAAYGERLRTGNSSLEGHDV